jgi:protein-disulfide isomerase
MVTRWRAALDGVATVAMILTSGVLVWTALSGRAQRACGSQTPEAPLPSEPVSLEGAQTQGQPAARLALIEYADFACPSCASFARDTLPVLQRDYVVTGRVLFAFRHFPLERLHPLAAKMSAAAECAAVGGRFWAMHDRLFQSPSQLTLPKVMGFAEALGLEPSRYGACVNQDTMAAKIRQDIESARAGILGT